MSWSTLTFAAALVVFFVIGTVWWYWPQHDDGTRYSIEEMDGLIKNHPAKGSGGSQLPFILLSLITAIALALASARHERLDFED